MKALIKWAQGLSPLAPWVAAAWIVGLGVAAWWVVTEPGRQRDRADRAEAQGQLAGADAAAGAAAVETVVKNAEGQAAIDRRVKESEDAITAAGDPDAAALRELCRSPSTRAWPECRVLAPRP